MARSIDAARLRGHDVMVRVWVRLVMPCCALSSALTAILRELVKTARAEMASSPPSPFRLPAVCVSPRPPFLSSRMLLA